MNLYFLVEGQSTEKKVYPAWLSHLLPELKRVDYYDQVDKNNYYLCSAEGYPSIIHKHLPHAVEDIATHGKYNYLILCLDADEVSVNERKQEIHDFVVENDINLKLGNTKLQIIIQNRCIETWFLGNRKIYPKNFQESPLVDYMNHYDIFTNCPELMGNYGGFKNHSQFHEAYLKELFKAKTIKYSKQDPGEVIKSYYLAEILQRIKNETKHLPSFQVFLEFCRNIESRVLIIWKIIAS